MVICHNYGVNLVSLRTRDVSRMCFLLYRGGENMPGGSTSRPNDSVTVKEQSCPTAQRKTSQ